MSPTPRSGRLRYEAPVLARILDGTKLVAKLPAPLAKGAIVVISGTDGDNHMISSRYIIN